MAADFPVGDLKLIDLTRRFGPVTAVDNLNLTIPQGSFFALLGGSGCGKTTTLRMIAGLEQPTSGRILLAGQDIARLRPYRRPVNTVFQSYALFPHLSVFDNVAFGLRRKGIRDVTAQVKQMLDLVHLPDYGSRRPSQLSGGQQQRVALARALINHPQVLLLDEPLGALDLKLRRMMQIELKRIQTEVGVTFVHVTHDQEEAMTMADTVAVMNAGQIEQLGAPADMYEYPATAFVANFLGQSNLLPGQADGTTGDDVPVLVHGARFAVPVNRSRIERGPVYLGVRPEKLHLAKTADDVPAGHQHLSGVITDASYLGVSTQYLVKTGWGGELSVFVANNGAATLLPMGAEVVVYWLPEHAFLLSRKADEAREPIEVEPVGVAP